MSATFAALSSPSLGSMRRPAYGVTAKTSNTPAVTLAMATRGWGVGGEGGGGGARPVAEPAQRGGARRLRRGSPRHEVVDAGLDVEAQLGVDVGQRGVAGVAQAQHAAQTLNTGRGSHAA